ncbi:Activating signal cointegrator 1 complex subunit 1 [Anthophora quadrimaculata]
MNILKPELIWIEDRCYRVLGNTKRSDSSNISPYVEDNYQLDFKDCEKEYDADIEIVPYKATQFKHTFHVPKSFFPFIAGSKHAVRKRLETETKTLIQIPKLGQDGDLVITGVDRMGIIKARHRINLLMEATRKKLDSTHFLSIPVNIPEIIKEFNLFMKTVLNNSEKTSRGIDETIFQTPSKLHLTIVVLTLLDDKERNQAIEALNYCQEYIVKPMIQKYGKIPIQLQGIDIMNNEPTKTRVLYAKIIDKSGALQKLVDEISNYYASIGLLYKTTDKVKLHVTLMNTKFKLHGTTKYTKETFDASEIIKTYENRGFGETVLTDIHLSQRHTIDSNGYYQSTAKINVY